MPREFPSYVSNIRARALQRRERRANRSAAGIDGGGMPASRRLRPRGRSRWVT